MDFARVLARAGSFPTVDLWDRSRRPEGGGEWEPIKISSKFESSAYVSKSPKPSSVLTKVWSSY